VRHHISNQRIKSIDGKANVTLITDYRVAVAKKKMTLTHQNLLGGLRCIFCPNVITSSVHPLGSGENRHYGF
jgi:hypothetical protein